MKYFKKLLPYILSVLFIATSVSAVTIFNVNQGGTGVGTITGIVQGNGTSPFSAITIGSGLDFTGGTLSATGGSVAGSDTQVQYNDGGSFGADANFAWDKILQKLSLGGVDTMTVNGTLIGTKLSTHSGDGLTQVDIEMHKHSNTAGAGASIYGARSRGGIGTETIVQNGDAVLNITGVGFDGTDYATLAQIQFEVDGTPGSNDMPGRIVFNTSADGGQTLTERMRISNNGNITFSGGEVSWTDATKVFEVNDGTDRFLRISGGAKTFAIGDLDGANPYIESNTANNEIQLVASILEMGGNRYIFPGVQGTAGQVLSVNSVSLGTATLEWVAAGGGGITGSGANTQIAVWTGATTQAGYNAFTWNNATGRFQITNGASPAKRAFLVDAPTFDVAMGDISSGGNNTSLYVGDSSQNIQFLGGDGLGGTGAVLDIYTNLSAGQGAILNMGDVSNLVNGTLFEVNDASQYIRMSSATSTIKGFDIDFGSNIFSFGDYTGVTVGGSNVGFLSIAPNIFSLYGEDGASGVNRFLAQTGGILYQGDVDGAVTGALSILDTSNSTFNIQSGGAKTFDANLARFNTTQGDVDSASNGVIFEVNDQNQYIRGTIGSRPVLNLDRTNELYEIGRITGGNTTHISIDDSARDIDLNSGTVTISGVQYNFPNADGTSGQALSTNGSGGLSWTTLGGVTTVGTIDTATPSADGAVITGSSIFMQSASSTRPGLVNTTTQVFSGLKAFLTGIEATAGAITGTGGAGFLDFFSQSSTPTAPSTSFLRLWQQSNRMFFSRNGGIDASIDFNSISADRNYVFPDLAGTVALLTGAQTFTDKIISVVSGGNTTTQSRVGGSYATSTTATSNSGSGETNLFSTAIGANTLNTNGDKIRFKGAGTFNTSANNKRLRVKFGGTTIYDSTALAITTANSWIVEGEIIRSSSTAVKVSLNVSSSSALLAATAVYLPITGLTLSNSNNLDITGQGTASADMTGEMLSVDFMPN